MKTEIYRWMSLTCSTTRAKQGLIETWGTEGLNYPAGTFHCVMYATSDLYNSLVQLKA